MTGPKVRIVTGPTAVVEHELNKEWENYVINSLTFTWTGTEMHCTAVLVATSEMRKAAMMAPGVMNFGGPQ